MLTGKDLGQALKGAMERKGVTQAEVASEFGIQQPSVSEWIKFGRIAKKHIPHLVQYFSDKVGPEHWGLPASWSVPAAADLSSFFAKQPSPAGLMLAHAYDELPDGQVKADLLGKLLARVQEVAAELRSKRHAPAPTAEPTPSPAPARKRRDGKTPVRP
ncbi:MAG: helix-turn-helix transcriptional regulator [Burkholderiales bacterium]|nr:helix-turn-helix transcriptional regulator [Burkholderiales bacterium]